MMTGDNGVRKYECTVKGCGWKMSTVVGSRYRVAGYNHINVTIKDEDHAEQVLRGYVFLHNRKVHPVGVDYAR